MAVSRAVSTRRATLRLALTRAVFGVVVVVALVRSDVLPPGAAPLSAVRPWSCDTFAVHAGYTRYGATLFGKNSDQKSSRKESPPAEKAAPSP